MSLLTLTELRERAAAALAPASESDPPVLDSPVDSVQPPALILAWVDPWLTFRSPCFWDARLAVLCVAGRVDPRAGVATLEQLVGYVVSRLRADAYTFPHSSTQAPREYLISGVHLLGARVDYACPVTLNGGP